MHSVLGKSWHDRRRGLIGWVIGVVALVLVAILFWPTIRDNSAFQEAFENIPDALKVFIGEDVLTSPSGYLDSRLFLFTIPILYLIYAIGLGADAIAGEEQRHTMDLLLSHPITRARVLLEKYGAICIGLAIQTVVLLVTTVLGVRAVDMDMSATNISAASIGVLMLGMHFGALSIMLSAATGKRAIANGIASAVATAAYLINSLAPQVDALQGVRKLSAFYYASGSSPLKTGFSFEHLAVLAVTTALFLWAAVWFFDRRDVAV